MRTENIARPIVSEIHKNRINLRQENHFRARHQHAVEREVKNIAQQIGSPIHDNPIDVEIENHGGSTHVCVKTITTFARLHVSMMQL